ncbi:hypothetical protein FRC12_002140 [Ceratobasidium sp. 428]|nr:hypothetical protein FRC12_002140 [Ceratobasidium sp. 428]
MAQDFEARSVSPPVRAPGKAKVAPKTTVDQDKTGIEDGEAAKGKASDSSTTGALITSGGRKKRAARKYLTTCGAFIAHMVVAKPPAPKPKNNPTDSEEFVTANETSPDVSMEDGTSGPAARATGKKSTEGPEDTTVMYGGTMKALCRTSESHHKRRVKILAMEHAIQEKTIEAEKKKQETFAQQGEWLARFESALSDLAPGSDEYKEFFNLAFNHSVVYLTEAETQLEAQKCAVKTKELHIVQLEKELLIAKQDLEQIKIGKSKAGAAAALGKFMGAK